jgi:hypothetical protein
MLGVRGGVKATFGIAGISSAVAVAAGIGL